MFISYITNIAGYDRLQATGMSRRLKLEGQLLLNELLWKLLFALETTVLRLTRCNCKWGGYIMTNK